MVKPRLTAAERLVMKIIWDADHELVLRDVLQEANDHYKRDWKPQTVTAYLSHLVQKGFLEMHKEGRNFFYTVLVEEESYYKEYVQKEVDFWTRNDRMQFVSGLFKAMNIKDEEYDEIAGMIEDLKNE